MNNACPACDAPLIAFEFKGVELDHCVQCQGTWLDPGELEQIALLAGTVGDPLFLSHPGASGVLDDSRRVCPRCGIALKRQICPAGDVALTLDICPRGDGLWFDRGELIALLKSGAGSAADDALKQFLGDLFCHELEHQEKGA